MKVTRNGRTYYYECVRTPRGVDKRYLGTGAGAEILEELRVAERAERAEERAALNRLRENVDEKDAEAAEAIGQLQTAITAGLLAAGYHRPARKPWKRRKAHV